jgi:hypothetical protein
MSADIRPAIFVSATSRDLASCRTQVKEALLSLGCVPVEQQNFPPDAGSVRQMLRARLRTCHAVIHLAGMVYGSEPTERSSGEPRRSYTQLEVDIARELRVPVYVFVCSEDFPYDAHQPESDELAELQRVHRRRLTDGDAVYESVQSLNALERRVLMLQDRVAVLRKELERSRRTLRTGFGVAAAALVALCASVYVVGNQTAENTRRIASVRTELDEQREHIRLVADAYMRLKLELRQLALTPDQLWARAVAGVAEREGIEPARFASGIELFVAATRDNPSADLLDRALADLAVRDFASSADNAGRAAGLARSKRLAAETLAKTAHGEAQAALDEECAALAVQAKALAAAGDFPRAVSVLEEALGATTREDRPLVWADLQFQVGVAELEWARRAGDGTIAEHNHRATAAFRSALEVYSRDVQPAQWALAKNNLAITLQDQAAVTDGLDRLHLLDQAVRCHRAALEVHTREASPQEWAMSMNNLANALSMRAEASPQEEYAAFLEEAVQCYRHALQVRTRSDFPQDWAAYHNNLSIALIQQSASVEGERRSEIIAAAATSLLLALEVLTPEAYPQDWAMAQSNLASLQMLRSQFDTAAEGARADLLNDAAIRYRRALLVYTLEAFPQQWAGVQNNYADIKVRQGISAPASEQAAHFAEAVHCCELALKVRTRESMPHHWAKTQRILARALGGQARASPDPQRSALLREAIDVLRRCLDGFARVHDPEQVSGLQEQIAELEAALSMGQ